MAAGQAASLQPLVSQPWLWGALNPLRAAAVMANTLSWSLSSATAIPHHADLTFGQCSCLIKDDDIQILRRLHRLPVAYKDAIIERRERSCWLQPGARRDPGHAGRR